MKPRILLAIVLLATSAASAATRSSLLVSTDWLARHLNDPKVVVLHIAREHAAYDQGHIPGARFVPYTDLAVARDGLTNELPPAAALQQVFERAGVADDSRVVLYGENSGLLAARAFVTLDYLGHSDRAALLDGGLEKWRAEQRPLSTAAPQIAATHLTVSIRPEIVVQLSVVRDLSWAIQNQSHPAVVLLDARPAEQFSGAKSGEGVSRAGHIPGAKGLYWMETFKDRDHPELRPVAELRRMFAAAGVTPGQKVVTYCHSGVQASFLYFVARYLGYDVALYDGSFLEWSKAPGTEVATSSNRP